MNDLQLYDRLGEDWWKPDGPAAALRAMNRPRFAHWDRSVRFTRRLCLDLGCGGGLTIRELLKRQARPIGADRSVAAVRVALRHCPGAGYIAADARAIPLRDASVEIVLACDLLEHLEREDRHIVLQEIRRVLRPGGMLLFDTINRTWYARIVIAWALEWLGIVPRGTHDARLFVPPDELARDLRAAGLVPRSVTGFWFRGHPARARHHLSRWLGLCYAGTAVKPGPRRRRPGHERCTPVPPWTSMTRS